MSLKVPTIETLPMTAIVNGSVGFAVGTLARSPSPLFVAQTAMIKGLAHHVFFLMIADKSSDLDNQYSTLAFIGFAVTLVNIGALRYFQQLNTLSTCSIGCIALISLYNQLSETKYFKRISASCINLH